MFPQSPFFPGIPAVKTKPRIVPHSAPFPQLWMAGGGPTATLLRRERSVESNEERRCTRVTTRTPSPAGR